jgi:hypothetical protein
MLEPKDIIQGGFGDCYFFISCSCNCSRLSLTCVSVICVREKILRIFMELNFLLMGLGIRFRWMGVFPINGYGAFLWGATSS